MRAPAVYRAALRLYPRAWRERHGDEVLSTIEESGGRARVREIVALVGGAIRATAAPPMHGDDESPRSTVREGLRLGALYVMFFVLALGYVQLGLMGLFGEMARSWSAVSALYVGAFALALKGRDGLAVVALLLAGSVQIADGWDGLVFTLVWVAPLFVVPILLLLPSLGAGHRRSASYGWLGALVVAAAGWLGIVALAALSSHRETGVVWVLVAMLTVATVVTVVISRRNPLPAIGLGCLHAAAAAFLVLIRLSSGGFIPMETDEALMVAYFAGSALAVFTAAAVAGRNGRPSLTA